jgi:allantoinase
MMRDGHRDLVGYGRNSPHPRWPNDARLAISFVLNIEEGSEYSIGDGDGFAEATVTEFDASLQSQCSSSAAASASGVC